MVGVLRVPRSRGALSGVVLVLLGVWGALVPFIGPYFQFAYTPGTVWVYTPARLSLEVVPGLATAAGGLILLSSANRAFAAIGAWLAALAGAWFIIGPTLSRLWPPLASHRSALRSAASSGGRSWRSVTSPGWVSSMCSLPPSRWADWR